MKEHTIYNFLPEIDILLESIKECQHVMITNGHLDDVLKGQDSHDKLIEIFKSFDEFTDYSIDELLDDARQKAFYDEMFEKLRRILTP